MEPRDTGVSLRPERDPFVGSSEVHVAARRARAIMVFLGVLALCAMVGVALVVAPTPLVLGAIGAVAGGLAMLVQPFIGLLLYLITFFVRPGELMPALEVLHLERLVGGFTLVCMFFELYRQRGTLVIDGSRQTFAFMAFVGAMVLSMPTSYWPGGTADRIVEMLKIFALYLMIVHLVTNPRRLRVFLGLYLTLLVYVAVSTLIDFLQGNFDYAQGVERAVGRTSVSDNPNQLGTTLAAIVPVFLFLARGQRRRVLQALLVSCAGLSIWVILMTGSRASLLGLVAALCYVIWTTRRRTAWLLAAIAVAPLVFVSLPDQYKERYATITTSVQGDIDGSSVGRLDAWKAGAKMLVDRPLFGVGAGCFGVAHAETYSAPGRRNWLESHSLYVQVPAEVGLVGAISFFGFMFIFLRFNRKVHALLLARGEPWHMEAMLMQGLWAGFLVLLIAGVFGHSLYRTTWYEYAAIGLAVYRVQASSPQRDTSA